MKQKDCVRKLATTLLIGALAISPLTACGGSSATGSSDSADTTASSIKLNDVEFSGLTFGLPADWEESQSEDNDVVYTSPDGGIMFIGKSDGITYSADLNDDIDAIVSSTNESEDTNISNIKESSDGEAVIYTGDMTATSDDEGEFKGFAKIAFSGSSVYVVFTYVPESDYESQKDTLDAIEDSIHVANPMAPVQASSTSQSDDSTSSNSGTTSQNNAVDKAKSYVAMTGFSRDGLVEQLKYEGFSDDDAAYGADNCGADWNAEAVEKAKGYIDMTGFSYSGLIEQLEYEGFTTEQATYGADNCGADWNAEAAEKAKSYMDMQSFSRSGLIDQLEYEGFTADQAAYGADSVDL